MNLLLIAVSFFCYIFLFIKVRLWLKVNLSNFWWAWDQVCYMYPLPFPHYLWTVHPFSFPLYSIAWLCSSCRVNVISQGMSESKQIAQESRNHMERFVVYHVYLSVRLSASLSCLSVYVSFLPVCIFFFLFDMYCTGAIFKVQSIMHNRGGVFFFVMGFLDFDSTAYIHHIYKHTHNCIDQ